MTVKRYAMVKDNIVYNITMWDGDTSTWQPPDDGTIMIEHNSVSINDWWEESEQRFYRPIPTAEELEKIKQERGTNGSSGTSGS